MTPALMTPKCLETTAANAPVLFFDSGVGGLSILSPALKLLPDMPVIYAADRAGFPYGTKSEAEIMARVPALLGRLVERFRPRMAVIACNTASTIALSHVRAALDIPVVGTVPAIKPAALTSVSRVIGVLGTEATVRQPYVDRLAAMHGADCTILRHGSAALVALAEAKLRGETLDPDVARHALLGLIEQPDGDKMDRIVLSCTHFPLVQPELEQAAREIGLSNVQFLHGGEGIARRIAYLNATAPWPDARPDGTAIFTRMDQDVDALKPALAKYGLTRIEAL